MALVKKIARVLLALLCVLGIGVFVAVAWTSISPVRPVGFHQALVTDPGHRPIPVAILYPTSSKPRWTWFGIAAVKLAPDGAIDGKKLPLVVISHGNYGTQASHLDTVLALVEAGYVVAVPLHHGDNFQDTSQVGTSDWIVNRARHIARANDYMLRQWQGRAHVDATKIGVFGYSAGGVTGLVTIGGTPDFARVGPHCNAKREFICDLLKPGALRVPAASEWAHDPRVQAAVIVAPGFGFAFDPDGLAGVKVPVQLWAGGADRNLPLATNAGAVRRLLPVPTEFHLVERAGHFSFLPPCGLLKPLLPRMLCTDPPGFDRQAFHKIFNAAVVAFFNEELGKSPDAL